MGSRDYRHREPKKPKKDLKKVASATVIPTPMMVEVVKKGKKEQEEEAKA